MTEHRRGTRWNADKLEHFDAPSFHFFQLMLFGCCVFFVPKNGSTLSVNAPKVPLPLAGMLLHHFLQQTRLCKSQSSLKCKMMRIFTCFSPASHTMSFSSVSKSNFLPKIVQIITTGINSFEQHCPAHQRTFTVSTTPTWCSWLNCHKKQQSTRGMKSERDAKNRRATVVKTAGMPGSLLSS